MFRHVALFRWTDDATGEARARVVDELRRYAGTVRHLGVVTVGADAGLADGNWHLALVGDFRDRAAYEAYRDDPTHRALVDQHVRPILAARAAVQHEVD